jgi:hypothetical protein
MSHEPLLMKDKWWDAQEWWVSPRTGHTTAAFAKARREARERFYHDVRIYYVEGQHQQWRDLKAASAAWTAAREAARKTSEEARQRKWRQMGDEGLRQRLRELYANKGAGEERVTLKVTWTVLAVLEAELQLVSESSMLYASAEGIARRAHVCADTVTKVNKTLELLGVLKRRRSGGICNQVGHKDFGRRQTNVYAFDHQELRRVLDMPYIYQSAYDMPEEMEPDSVCGKLYSSMLYSRQEAKVKEYGGRGDSWHPAYNGFGYVRRRPLSPVENLDKAATMVYKCAADSLISALLCLRTKKERHQESQPYSTVSLARLFLSNLDISALQAAPNSLSTSNFPPADTQIHTQSTQTTPARQIQIHPQTTEPRKKLPRTKEVAPAGKDVSG